VVARQDTTLRVAGSNPVIRSLKPGTPRSGDAERAGIRKIDRPVSDSTFRILVSDSQLTSELGEALGRAGCLVQDEGEGALLVQVSAPTPEQAERELRLYVASWLALNEGAEVEIKAA